MKSIQLFLKSAMAGAVILGWAATPGAAQNIPNLVGTWKGATEAVFIGPNPYRVAESMGANFGGPVEFTYVVKQQQGTRFAGELVTPKVTEMLIGALRPPEFRTGIFLDNDGEYDFTVRDANTIDMCYRHNNMTSKVVSCWTLQRQP